MENGKRYLVKIRQDKKYYILKMAYWFDERPEYYKYKRGFFLKKTYYYPYKNVVGYVDLNNIPNFYSWNIDIPIEGEKYLVYRVGSTDSYSPHYTIRKFHNGNFGSNDVKYWIKLSEVIKNLFFYDYEVINSE